MLALSIIEYNIYDDKITWNPDNFTTIKGTLSFEKK